MPTIFYQKCGNARNGARTCICYRQMGQPPLGGKQATRELITVSLFRSMTERTCWMLVTFLCRRAAYLTCERATCRLICLNTLEKVQCVEWIVETKSDKQNQRHFRTAYHSMPSSITSMPIWYVQTVWEDRSYELRVRFHFDTIHFALCLLLRVYGNWVGKPYIHTYACSAAENKAS
jgi:hypothetical protein